METCSTRGASSRREFLRHTLALSGSALLTACHAGVAVPGVPQEDGTLSRVMLAAGNLPLGVCQNFPWSFFSGGFECSTHVRLTTRERLDLTSATLHDVFAREDYARMMQRGMSSCRDGVSWVLSEPAPGRYDFSRFRSMLQAARSEGMFVIWDLLHFGWPQDIDVFKPEFVTRYASYARETARVLLNETDNSIPPIVCPINEISFLSWAGADEGFFNPFERGRGFELKVQLSRAAIAGMAAMREVLPTIRFLHCDPLVHIAASPMRFWDRAGAEKVTRFQYQSWDMVSGCLWPQLGGSPAYLDIVGVNYYSNNQSYFQSRFIDSDDARYVPLSTLILRTWKRYGRPILISETGMEGHLRPEWLRYVSSECVKVLSAGCPLLGAVWYPIVNHPGWSDDRHCKNGLWDYANLDGSRPIYEPLAAEIAALNPPLTRLRNAALMQYCARLFTLEDADRFDQRCSEIEDQWRSTENSRPKEAIAKF